MTFTCPQCGQLASDGNHFCPVPMTISATPIPSAINDLRRRVATLEAQAHPPQAGDDVRFCGIANTHRAHDWGAFQCPGVEDCTTRKTATTLRSRVEDGHGVSSAVEGAGDSRVDVRASEPEPSSSTAGNRGQNRAADLEQLNAAIVRAENAEANARVLAGRVDELNAKLADATARAEAAEAKVAEQRVEYRLMSDSQDHWRRIALNLERERDAERERAGRLALYAKHQYGCGVDTKGGMFAPGPCTCGLDAALALPASDTKEDGDA